MIVWCFEIISWGDREKIQHFGKYTTFLKHSNKQLPPNSLNSSCKIGVCPSYRRKKEEKENCNLCVAYLCKLKRTKKKRTEESPREHLTYKRRHSKSSC